MKYLASLAFALAVAQATPVKRSSPLGIDVSDYQPNIDWTTVVDNGVQFVYIKATEGTCLAIQIASLVYALSYTAVFSLHLALFQSSIHWCYGRWPHPRSLPFCTPRCILGCCSGYVLPAERG